MSLFPNDNLRRRSDFPGDSCGKCDRLAELERENEALRKDAERYRWLRSRDLDTIDKGGVFAGMTPRNIVLNEEHLDTAIDAALKEQNKC